MRIPDLHRATERAPSVDELDFKSLYRKSTYEVKTADDWTLVITRYQPIPQLFEQPLFNEPLMLVHGFSQNRHAWTCGKFVKYLLYYGVDVHVLELRGHGKSSVKLQRQKAAEGHKLPADIDYGWDLDSYFLYDLPAAVAAVKRVTRRDQIFYCGHSMGGMLGYGYAGLHDDLLGLITIGAASDLGRDFLLLKAASYLTPLSSIVDALFYAQNAGAKAKYLGRRTLRTALGSVAFARALAERLEQEQEPVRKAFEYVPVDLVLKQTEKMLARNYNYFERYWPHVAFLANPARMAAADMRWLLREGGEREPRKVVEQFARWIRNGHMVCYRTGYDLKKGFSNIEIPLAIIFGDRDRLASVRSTRSIYRSARSEYILWRPVKGNSHIELTMGRDLRQICFDVKNLMEYAVRHRPPSPASPALT